ncbi:Zn peptidase [Pleurocapsa sp. CCALA 161]|uniref:ImmA/IrrE family metallo-endopeptidase n=1 Tax=Pleurocapsa sp. CCALA 161 TaxID=2107688 RepID=UPI000D080CC3|nr:ImmA/IrrE family metallo-endopeptidase [Pleurocapsa sp. CCALA 161]PSB12498.1 Zn peptidase [Pleurocapsa sp. CCALA 161]
MSVFRPFRFISKLEIEAYALNIWLQMERSHNPLQLPIDASIIAEFLDLNLVWDTIPDDEQGAIAARILPLEKLIEINENIPQLKGGFGESTIAHEIGHWVLHIDVEQVERYIRLKQKGVDVQVKPFLCRSSNLARIEWQAQYFAGCLLMPQHILTELKQDKDLTKWQHLYQIATDLGVTISNLTTRLQDLGWIYLDTDTRKIYLNRSS